jgi:predicted membrane-bound spermidine synthase
LKEGRNFTINREIIKANMVVFIASFCTLVIELVAGRIMAPYVGVSLYTWTSIIGVVLAGISIGAYLGGLIADRYPSPSTLGWLLFLSGVGALTIAPLTNLIGAAQFNTSLMLRILILTSAIFFVPACILGMISPVVVKLTLNNLDNTGNIVGKIYASDNGHYSDCVCSDIRKIFHEEKEHDRIHCDSGIFAVGISWIRIQAATGPTNLLL